MTRVLLEVLVTMVLLKVIVAPALLEMREVLMSLVTLEMLAAALARVLVMTPYSNVNKVASSSLYSPTFSSFVTEHNE